MFFIYLLILLGTIVFYTERKRAKIGRAAKNVTTPPYLPVIGNGLKFIGKTPPEIFQVITETNKTYGDQASLWIGTHLIVALTNPKDVEVLFTNPTMTSKPIEYDLLRPWLGDGVLLSNGPKWHSRRKLITSAFHFKMFNDFVKIFDEQASTFIKILSKFKPTDKIDISELVSLFTLDVICESAMGTTANAQLDYDSNYVKAVRDITQSIHLRMCSFLLHSDFLFRLSSGYGKQQRALKTLHQFTDSVIAKRRAELLHQQKISYNQTTEDDFGERKKMAMLDVLLQATIEGTPLTDLDIREEVDTIMFGGHDTTASALIFVFYEIAKNKDIQEKLLQEIKSVLGNDKTMPVTISDLNNLNYLELVIKESLRLYPAVPILGRRVTEDTQINEKVIPAGSTVIVGIHLMNRDPLLFKDPEKFIPERFDIDGTKEVFSPYTYIPFSAGPRNCIGQKFAFGEMKSVISKTIRYFELSLATTEKPVLMAELVLRPWNKILLHVKPRYVNKMN